MALSPDEEKILQTYEQAIESDLETTGEFRLNMPTKMRPPKIPGFTIRLWHMIKSSHEEKGDQVTEDAGAIRIRRMR